MQQAKEDRSLGDLFADLTRETTTLVRQEVQLARTEITQKASSMARDVALIAAGGAVIYAGFLALLAGVIMALTAIGVPGWLAAFLVGIVVALAGYFLVQRGREALKRTNLVPEKTIETLKEDAEWIKQQTQ